MIKIAEFNVEVFAEEGTSNNKVADFAQRLRGASYGWFRRHKSRGTVRVTRVNVEE